MTPTRFWQLFRQVPVYYYSERKSAGQPLTARVGAKMKNDVDCFANPVTSTVQLERFLYLFLAVGGREKFKFEAMRVDVRIFQNVFENSKGQI